MKSMIKAQANNVEYPLQVSIQIEAQALEIEEQSFVMWANHAYQAMQSMPSEVVIRIVAEDEMRALNQQFRGIAKPTNVLSFEMDDIPEADISLLGDVVICHPVVVDEAQQQGKPLNDHYAHMVVHGILHLCGLEHEQQQQAEKMEAIEIKLLNELDITNPYYPRNLS